MQFKKTLCTFVIGLSTLLVPSVAFGQAYGKVTVETLNLRNNPSTTAANIGQLDQSEEVEIVGRIDEEWLEILTHKGTKAYVYSSFVEIVDAEGIITGRGVRLRDFPSTTNSEIFATLYNDERVIIEYTVGDWCKVIANGQEGFISKEFISSSFMQDIPTKTLSEVERAKKGVVQTATARNVVQGSNGNNSEASVIKSTNVSLGNTIATDALQFLGGRYVYGGNSLTNGVDCSGFTQQIMKRHGINISRSSRSQYANDGYKVSKDELQAGDLLFYGYSGNISHVALYIGGGQVIHANTSSTGIIISPAFNAGKPYIGAKRVL